MVQEVQHSNQKKAVRMVNNCNKLSKLLSFCCLFFHDFHHLFSIQGLIKDRRSFKYSVSLHPNITRPNRLAADKIAKCVCVCVCRCTSMHHLVSYCFCIKGMEQTIWKPVFRRQHRQNAQLQQSAKQLNPRSQRLFLHSIKMQKQTLAKAQSTRTV